MPTVALVGLKGGVGKTTLAVHLAYQLAHMNVGHVHLIDADPQESAIAWIEECATYAGWTPPFTTSADTLRHPETIDTRGAQYVIIDTPPGDPATIQAALTVADMILIPTSPSSLDMRRTWQLIDTLDGRLYHMVINKSRPSTSSAKELRAIVDRDIPTATWEVPLAERIAATYDAPEKQFARISREFFAPIARGIRSEFTAYDIMTRTK